jgi:hypothetical protein
MYNYSKKLGYDINASTTEIFEINEITFIIICIAMFLASFVLLARKLKGVI